MSRLNTAAILLFAAASSLVLLLGGCASTTSTGAANDSSSEVAPTSTKSAPTPTPTALYSGRITLTLDGSSTGSVPAEYAGYTFDVKYDIASVDATTQAATQVGQSEVSADVTGDFTITNTTAGGRQYPAEAAGGILYAYPDQWLSLTLTGYYPASSAVCTRSVGMPVTGGCILMLKTWSEPHASSMNNVSALLAGTETEMTSTDGPGSSSRQVADADAPTIAAAIKQPAGFAFLTGIPFDNAGNGNWGATLAGGCAVTYADGLGNTHSVELVAQGQNVPRFCS